MPPAKNRAIKDRRIARTRSEDRARARSQIADLPDDLVLYTARHTFGTEFMEATKNLKLTMVAMGQVNVKTALRYQHPEMGQVSDIMNQRNTRRKSVTAKNGHTFGHTERAA